MLESGRNMGLPMMPFCGGWTLLGLNSSSCNKNGQMLKTSINWTYNDQVSGVWMSGGGADIDEVAVLEVYSDELIIELQCSLDPPDPIADEDDRKLAAD